MPPLIACMHFLLPLDPSLVRPRNTRCTSALVHWSIPLQLIDILRKTDSFNVSRVRTKHERIQILGACGNDGCIYSRTGRTLPGLSVTYGTPRVGNAVWAALFDSLISDFQRVNNKDVIPIIPGRFMGFSHVQGEVHIISPGDAVECPGDDDDTNAQCTIMSVPNIAEGDFMDHMGPYKGIYIGTVYCT